ncbi:MAG: hypothetical protein KAS77_06095, partial [Thermoplasmata archaeon]|nr:hypothetical protein [Thermoplasmata archaeon]
KVPSKGLNVFIAIMISVFVAAVVVGANRIDISRVAEVSNADWLKSSGVGLVIIGIVAIGILILSMIRFDHYHKLLAFLSILFIPLAITTSNHLSSLIASRFYWTVKQSAHDLYSTLFIIDFVIIGIIGLYVYLKHYKIMSNKEVLSV